MKTRKMVYLALLSAIAIILHMVDHYLSAPLPFGVKFGIANIISLMAIELYGIKEMWIINIMRVVISGLLTGSIMTYPFFMSCGGVFLSSLALSILHIFHFLPMVSTSIISAICHNIGQIIVISFIISSKAVVPYIFIMLISSIPTGILTALIAQEALKRIKT
ncbi:MAG: Gx transporter family protein [Erysipelotrichaceae bacterium]|nr:Gx transporter family protein [Erysipelotrichaceae bacterium]